LTILSALPVKNDGKMSKIKERRNPKESERKTKKKANKTNEYER
jgi:hypothetical protein